MKLPILATATLLLSNGVLAGDPGFAPQCDSFNAALNDRYKGKWQVAWTYRTAPGEYSKTTATSRIANAPGACGIREHFEGARDEPYFYEWTTTSLNAPTREGVWLDSAHGRFLHYKAAEGTDDWPVRFVWSHKNDRLQTRFQYSTVKDDSFTIERHLSSDGGQSWALTSSAVYRPYKKPPPNPVSKSR